MERKPMADRDGQGRFLPGWKGGPGRPRRAVEADYLRTLSDAVPLDRWREICDVAVEQALAGDSKAREWSANYLMPKPTGTQIHAMVFAGWPGEVTIDADGNLIHRRDAIAELLDRLNTDALTTADNGD
jgi:hypothetical protein